MCTEMNEIQRNVILVFQKNEHLKKNIIKTCRENATISANFTNPSIDVSGLVNHLHASIINYEAVYKSQTSATAAAGYVQKNDDETYFVNRQFKREQQYRGREREKDDRYPQTPKSSTFRKKRCFVCNRENCWSINHIQQERDDANKRFGDQYSHLRTRADYTRKLTQYITDLKNNDDDEMTQYFEELQIDFEPTEISATFNVQSYENDEVFCNSLNTLKNFDCILIINFLTDHAAKHQITDIDESENSNIENFSISYAYTSSTSFKYDVTEFKDLLIDSDAATRSTDDIGQLKALQKIDDTIQLNQSTAESANFVFEIGSTGSIGSINISTSIEPITFHIISVNILFLLCLTNLDKSETFFNNVTNKVIQQHQKLFRSHPVFKKYEHAFLLWNIFIYAFINESFIQHFCFFIETEIRRLHRRFGHFSMQRFYQILDRAGHEMNQRIIQRLIKYCHHCQKHDRFFDKFNFTIKNDMDFNFHIIVDIFYIEEKPVLHFIDEATRFQTDKWLKNIIVKNVWNQLRTCWIDIYFGSFDLISADAEKQFVVQKFRHYANNMKIMKKNVSVETHHSIDQIERYHELFRKIYLIIISKIPGMDSDFELQMTLKTVNDSIESHELISILLIFGAYSRMTKLDAFSFTINQRVIIMKKAMDEMRKFNANRQINDVFNTRNGSSTTYFHDLLLNSFVLMYRERFADRSNIWKKSFNLINIENESAILNLFNGPTKFRTTSVKPYHDPSDLDIDDENNSLNDENPKIFDVSDFPEHPISPETNDENSKDSSFFETNRPFFSDDSAIQPIRRGRKRSRKQISKKNFIFTLDIYFFSNILNHHPYVKSRKKKMIELIEKRIFMPINKKEMSEKMRIFNSRFVDEVKNVDTDSTFEKSRLMMQAYNDSTKHLVLTQSPTIQRVSQRLILCFAAIVLSIKLYLRNVIQAYVQFNTRLNRDFYIKAPYELASMLRVENGSIIKIMKPLYGVLEVGNHWFAIYHKHHFNVLAMKKSTYDSCLLYNHESFGIVEMQTNDTLLLAIDDFANKKEKAVKSTKILIKNRSCFTSINSIKFNDMKIQLHFSINNSISYIILFQKTHIGEIILIQKNDTSFINNRKIIKKNLTPKNQYIAQRVENAYFASICQSEISFDLSYAAQSTEYTPDDISQLNKRLTWQLINKSRRFKYVRLHQNFFQLIVFCDVFFVNNRDLSSQIDYVICLTDKTGTANLIHWSSIKCKRIIKNVLTSKLYVMNHVFDIETVIKTTIEKIFDIHISFILCIDSKSLYDYLMKFGITNEKRFMIDIMSFRQSYERREITEVRWIDENKNPADAMTKAKTTSVLKMLIDSNRIDLRAVEWVEK